MLPEIEVIRDSVAIECTSGAVAVSFYSGNVPQYKATYHNKAAADRAADLWEREGWIAQRGKVTE